jgi:hypothetical protein
LPVRSHPFAEERQKNETTGVGARERFEKNKGRSLGCAYPMIALDHGAPNARRWGWQSINLEWYSVA